MAVPNDKVPRVWLVVRQAKPLQLVFVHGNCPALVLAGGVPCRHNGKLKSAIRSSRQVRVEPRVVVGEILVVRDVDAVLVEDTSLLFAVFLGNRLGFCPGFHLGFRLGNLRDNGYSGLWTTGWVHDGSTKEAEDKERTARSESGGDRNDKATSVREKSKRKKRVKKAGK